MRKIFALVLFFVTCSVFAGPLSLDECKDQIPFGAPHSHVDNTQVVCHHAYILEHDNTAKIPVWVAYTLAPQHTYGCVARSNKFKADPDVASSAIPKDYAGTGYDKGHVANDADMSWREDVELESFYMTNMTPQLPNLNRGIWKKLEEDVREWALYRNHTLVVYAGPIYNVSKDKKIGTNKVDVPTGFYKIVIDTVTYEAMAFIFENKNYDSSMDPSQLETTIEKVEDKVNVHFALPVDVKETNTWALPDSDVVAQAKKKACK